MGRLKSQIGNLPLSTAQNDPRFVHLRVHSAYSLSEGAVQIKQLQKLCADNRMPAVALTDTSNLFGALEFSLAMMGGGVQPIIGCQIAVLREDGVDRSGRRPEPDPIVLLAQDEEGYHNFLKLTSHAFLKTESGETAQVPFEILAANSAGIICLTGGAEGPIGRLIASDQLETAEGYAQRLVEIFDGRLYMEIQRHGLPLEQMTEPGLLKIAYDFDIPLVATNEVFFSDRKMYEAHDALLCIATGKYVGDQNRIKRTPEHYFKSQAEMVDLFSDLPEAIDNTLVIAQRCAIASPTRDPILPAFSSADGRDEAGELAAMATEGLKVRLENEVFTENMTEEEREAKSAEYFDRLEFEIGVINEMGFPGYFLIVSDFIQWSKEHDVPVGPGRGSGAGSVVAWALTITDLDPLRFGLLFERFLNPERVSMPDFDIDFCQDKREQVIRYVQDKYGHDQVAQIITFGKLQAKAAVRDVGRVLQMPYGQVDRISKMIPANPANPVSLQQALDTEPRLREERANDADVARLLEIALQLEGLYRHASTHAAGVVIGDRPLDELVPLYRDPRSDMPVTQFSMKYAETAGLVKFDFLGLKTLTVLDRAKALLARRGIEVDYAKVPLDDPAVFELLSTGNTIGIFQLESSGMRDMLRKMRPDAFEDIIAIVALYRPGPMENIPTYIRRKHGEEEPDYLHPKLQPVLEETYGVIIYQEQVMEIARTLAGYSLGDADILRRAMGKKIQSEMDLQRAIFAKGAKEKGVSSKDATHIFDLVAKFANYGFNKSHAAAYALVSYHTAWLKANYPVEFMAASMSLDMNNTDKLNIFRQDLDRMKIPVYPPCLNNSEVEFSVEFDGDQGAVRYALAAVKNVGREAMAGIVREREENGTFKDVFDFAERLNPKHMNKRQAENLVRAGAFDDLLDHRAQVFTSIEVLLRQAQQSAEERGSGQVNLFGGAAESLVVRPDLPEVSSWTSMEKLKQEFDAIGFYLSGHPLDAWEKTLDKAGVRTSVSYLAGLGSAESAGMLAGTVMGKRELRTRKGKPLAFVQLSDATGAYEVTMFSETLEKYRDLLVVGQSLVLRVTGNLDNDQPRLTVQSLQRLESMAATIADGVRIFANDDKPLAEVATILKQGGRGRGRVAFVLNLEAEAKEVEFDLSDQANITPEVRQALKSALGVIDVHDI
ncbi:DNA polymerase III subunit alpha [Sneathiella sp. HT1-7]|uniref:DNA polymerase III subunit alpha n=1 Tax=Sneathiella sp. HT1-7 TaxID=2887192 RepID=UPI001D14980C|nr:DNA polymerase III subunit alpha [Sneathiella sp. HT1-7]MCC3306114.1 DNA polymerase III subunit alpha [Sneathiella sp. HT1-7]